jgi:hypothetical protein
LETSPLKSCTGNGTFELRYRTHVWGANQV